MKGKKITEIQKIQKDLFLKFYQNIWLTKVFVIAKNEHKLYVIFSLPSFPLLLVMMWTAYFYLISRNMIGLSYN